MPNAGSPPPPPPPPEDHPVHGNESGDTPGQDADPQAALPLEPAERDEDATQPVEPADTSPPAELPEADEAPLLGAAEPDGPSADGLLMGVEAASDAPDTSAEAAVETSAEPVADVPIDDDPPASVADLLAGVMPDLPTEGAPEADMEASPFIDADVTVGDGDAGDAPPVDSDETSHAASAPNVETFDAVETHTEPVATASPVDAVQDTSDDAHQHAPSNESAPTPETSTAPAAQADAQPATPTAPQSRDEQTDAEPVVDLTPIVTKQAAIESRGGGRGGGRSGGRGRNGNGRRGKDGASSGGVIGKDRTAFDPKRAELPKLIEKQPPHAVEAEMALLGSMVLDPQVIGDVVQIVTTADDYYLPKHTVIHQVLVDLYDENEPVDMVHLHRKLDDMGVLEQVGGLDYLLALGDAMPSAASARYYARLVRDKALIRRLIEAAGKILYEAYTSTEAAAEQIDQAEQSVFRLAEQRSSEDASELKVLLHETYERIQAMEGRQITGLETGFYELDEMTSGLQNGEMIILAARPSMGKTAFALNIAEHIAADTKQPVAVFSLEMGKHQLAQRLMCSRSGVDSHKLRRNVLNADDYHDLAMVVSELSEAPLYIDDTPGLTMLALRAKARRLAQRHHIKCIMIDYLQLMSFPGADNRQQEVSELSRGIKALARELNVPVICLSQLNRSPEQREGHRPRMSDLRESGSIEQDADVVMMLHREEYYHTNDPEWADNNADKVGVAELSLVKQRNGPTGTVKMQFSHETTRFNNLATVGMRG